MILLPLAFLYTQVSAQEKGKKEMLFAFTFGINNYGSEVFDVSALYKTKNNFTYSVGVGGFNTDNAGPTFFTAFLNVGKIWAIKKSRFFINAKTGPVYNAEFDLGNTFDFHLDFGAGTSGTSSGTPPPPPTKEKKFFPVGLQSSVSLSYQVVKHFQAELGINSNLNAQKGFAGVFLGVKLTGIGRK